MYLLYYYIHIPKDLIYSFQFQPLKLTFSFNLIILILNINVNCVKKFILNHSIKIIILW